MRGSIKVGSGLTVADSELVQSCSADAEGKKLDGEDEKYGPHGDGQGVGLRGRALEGRKVIFGLGCARRSTSLPKDKES